MEIVEPVLRAQRLRRSFGQNVVLDCIDLEMASGERIAVVGPNGSGKTTLLRCIAGTLAVDSGEIDVCQQPAGSVAAKSVVGASLSQERSFYLQLTGRANLLFFARLRHSNWRDAEEQVCDLEKELEIQDITPQRVDRCSTGMVQQLAFARALLGVPRLLLLDEPTRSMDEDAVARLWSALSMRPRTSVLIATHDRDDIERCSLELQLGG